MLIRNVIHIIFKFFSIFVIFIGVGYGVSRFILSKKNDNSTKRKFLGLFMELDNFSILAIAINFISHSVNFKILNPFINRKSMYCDLRKFNYYRKINFHLL